MTEIEKLRTLPGICLLERRVLRFSPGRER